MLAGFDPLVILYMPCDGTQDDLLHQQITEVRGQAGYHTEEIIYLQQQEVHNPLPLEQDPSLVPQLNALSPSPSLNQLRPPRYNLAGSLRTNDPARREAGGRRRHGSADQRPAPRGQPQRLFRIPGQITMVNAPKFKPPVHSTLKEEGIRGQSDMKNRSSLEVPTHWHRSKGCSSSCILPQLITTVLPPGFVVFAEIKRQTGRTQHYRENFNMKNILQNCSQEGSAAAVRRSVVSEISFHGYKFRRVPWEGVSRGGSSLRRGRGCPMPDLASSSRFCSSTPPRPRAQSSPSEECRLQSELHNVGYLTLGVSRTHIDYRYRFTCMKLYMLHMVSYGMGYPFGQGMQKVPDNQSFSVIVEFKAAQQNCMLPRQLDVTIPPTAPPPSSLSEAKGLSSPDSHLCKHRFHSLNDNPILSKELFLIYNTTGVKCTLTPSATAKQPQFPQPLPIRLVLQTLHQLCCPSLDTFQHLNVSFVVRGPKLNTVFGVRPHQCQVQGHNPFPSPAGHTIPDTSLDAVGLLSHLGTLLAHIQAAVNQHPQVLLCWAAFQPLFPKPVALHGVVVTQVQDLALHLVEPHTVGLGPSIQPVQIPLQSLPTLKQINTPAQLGVICKLTEGALHPLVQIIDKDIKQNWLQN
ncbi:hypothetical protein QYF61_010740 [Mycteria americana]|uniref:Uncharacterized protein n=1 Tax=Mycteria americana TaxID=33587 RepID=A0AAN7S0Q5_MYCAM|nr:hypothetical protein QYF61_010740 [Mycteria americana]